MWTMAVAEFHLSSGEFLAMTPRQLIALYGRFNANQERWDRRIALLACIIAEPNRDRDHRPEPYTVEDFMPKRSSIERPQAPEDQVAFMRMVRDAILARNEAANG